MECTQELSQLGAVSQGLCYGHLPTNSGEQRLEALSLHELHHQVVVICRPERPIDTGHLQTSLAQARENFLFVADSPIAVAAPPICLAVATALFQYAQPRWSNAQVQRAIDSA